MSPFFSYLVKAAVGLIPFYALYILVLRRLTFFRWNRFYLLASLGLSTIIPLLPFGYTRRPTGAPGHTGTVAGLDRAARPAIAAANDHALHAIGRPDWITIFYLLGATVMFFLLVRSLWKIYRLVKAGTPVPYGRVKVLLYDEKIPTSSFFSYVFISKNNLTKCDMDRIVAHESYHAVKLHSLDVLLMEVFKIIWWFNPLVYFYKRSLQEAHEYDVDQAVCLRYDRKAYAGLLLRLGSALSLAPANMFSMHPLQDRLKMLFTNRSHRSKKWIYLLLLPLVLIACEQLGMHRQANERKSILTIGSDTTTLVIDSTTTLEEIQQAAQQLKAKKNTDLSVLQYEADPAGKIVLIQLRIKNRNSGTSAMWDFRSVNKDFWKNYRIIVAEVKSPLKTPMLYMHSVKRTNNSTLPPAVASVRRGKALFQTNCASCHNPVKDMTGPALAGVTDRRSKAWIYAFTRHSAALIARGDTASLRVFNHWNKVPMTRFPKLSDSDIDDIFNYVNAYATYKGDIDF